MIIKCFHQSNYGNATNAHLMHIFLNKKNSKFIYTGRNITQIEEKTTSRLMYLTVHKL